MLANENNPPDNISPLVAEVVAAYLSKNTVDINDVPELIRQVHQSFLDLQKDSSITGMQRPVSEPAVAITKSVTPEHLICLEDGKKLKMLKRHLKTAYSMTPEQYRKRWSLPPDYPMVAPNYAKTRSRLAKDIGLGTRSRTVQ